MEDALNPLMEGIFGSGTGGPREGPCPNTEGWKPPLHSPPGPWPVPRLATWSPPSTSVVASKTMVVARVFAPFRTCLFLLACMLRLCAQRLAMTTQRVAQWVTKPNPRATQQDPRWPKTGLIRASKPPSSPSRDLETHSACLLLFHISE
jgi:hypothetical protein